MIVLVEKQMPAGTTRPRRTRFNPNRAHPVAHLLKRRKLTADEIQVLALAVHLDDRLAQDLPGIRLSFCLGNTAIVIGIDQREHQRRHIHARSQVRFQHDPIQRQ